MSKKSSIERNDFAQIGIVTRYELLKHLRRRRLFAVLAINFVVCALQLVIPPALGISYQRNVKDFAGSFFGFINLLIITSGAFFAGDAIASEFEHKTGYITFVNPVRRVTLVLGKFVAAFLSVVMVISIYYVVGILSMLGIYGSVPLEVAKSFVYAVLYICSVLGLTFFFSSIFKGSMGATLLSFFMLFMILPIVNAVFTFTGSEPWYVLTYAAGIITEIINPPSVRVEKIQVPNSDLTIWNFHPVILTSVVVLALYFAVTLMLSLFIAKRKEMT